MNRYNAAILGDGGWGTALGILLHTQGLDVTIWSPFAHYAAYLDRKRLNTKFLPGIRIPPGIGITHDMHQAASGANIVVITTPSQYLRQTLKTYKKNCPLQGKIYLSAVKGIEVGSLKRMSEVIHDEFGVVTFAVLSGPTIAHEVAQGLPSTAVIASGNKAIRSHLQGIFMTESFRIYTTDDVIGVELGGSLKNVIAIACGISDGLGFGTNTKAALLSRGLAEISRLGQAMHARSRTFSGISGLGDLVTTCISPYSRNRFVGEQIGKGKTLASIQSHMQMVAEGVLTTKSAYHLGLKYKIDMPITREVFNVLYKSKNPQAVVRDLMRRAKKEE